MQGSHAQHRCLGRTRSAFTLKMICFLYMAISHKGSLENVSNQSLLRCIYTSTEKIMTGRWDVRITPEMRRKVFVCVVPLNFRAACPNSYSSMAKSSQQRSGFSFSIHQLVMAELSMSSVFHLVTFQASLEKSTDDSTGIVVWHVLGECQHTYNMFILWSSLAKERRTCFGLCMFVALSIVGIFRELSIVNYCWWLKSCTSW